MLTIERCVVLLTGSDSGIFQAACNNTD